MTRSDRLILETGTNAAMIGHQWGGGASMLHRGTDISRAARIMAELECDGAFTWNETEGTTDWESACFSIAEAIGALGHAELTDTQLTEIVRAAIWVGQPFSQGE